jgi:hypothetical protein
MKIDPSRFHTVFLISSTMLLGGMTGVASSQDTGSGANAPVVVEEIQTGQPTNEEKAEALWNRTKEKTREAAGSAAEYSTVQGTRALEATKEGIAKGADLIGEGAEAVVEGSKKAWDSTVEVTGDAVEYSRKKAGEVGAAVSEALEKDPENPLDKSSETTAGDAGD